MNWLRKDNQPETEFGLSLLDECENDLNRIFDSIWSNQGLVERSSLRNDFVLDITDSGNKYEIEVDLPGFNKEDIKVEVAKDVLTIRGERKREINKNERGENYTERSFGAFARSIQLNTEINEKNIKATLRKGVLKLELPKVNPAPEKQIDIRVED